MIYPAGEVVDDNYSFLMHSMNFDSFAKFLFE